MQNISLDFFGEKITTIMPTDLASLRNIILEQFMFNPEDAAEVIITYMKDLDKKVIETEEDFKTFLNEKINYISLDIRQDSKLYKENFSSTEQESNENINELDNLNNLTEKKEGINSNQRKVVNDFNENVKNIDEQIQKFQNEIKKEKIIMKNGINKQDKEEKEVNKNIQELKEKLRIKNDENGTIKKVVEKKKIKKEKKQGKLKRNQEREKPKSKKEKKSIRIQKNENSLEKEESKIEENESFPSIEPINDDFSTFQAYFQIYKLINFPSICNGCGAFPIIGNRYKCKVCNNFDYCENCEAKYGNEHQHPFIKIYNSSQNFVDNNFVYQE